MLTDIRVFSRVLAGVFGYAWSVYLAIQGRELQASFSGSTAVGPSKAISLAFLIPALLSVVAIWAAVVDEEGILWTMSFGLIIFSGLFVFSGGLLFAPVAVGHLAVVALSRPGDKISRSRRPASHSRQK